MTQASSKSAAQKKLIAAALEYRLAVFPVVPETAPRTVETKWGGVRVERGNPSARHRDLLDAILAVGQRAVDLAGQVHVIFDLVKVKKLLDTETDWCGVRKMLLDLAATVISLRHPSQDWPPSFPILTFVGESQNQADRPKNQFQAKLKRITFSAGYSELLLREARIYMDTEMVSVLLSLQHQVTRSVARWCLSHSLNQHHNLADVLAAVGAINDNEPISGRHARSQVRQRVNRLTQDAGGLSKLGIKISNNVLHYSPGNTVFISTTHTPDSS